MISIISPAKTMDFSPINPKINWTNYEPTILYEKILESLLRLNIDDIQSIMKVSFKIAQENYQRYQSFEELPQKQALFAYDGDVYRNIDRRNLPDDVLDFAQNHLCIISGLYGLLKPLDRIKAYRLEMVSKLVNIAPHGLYKYWQNYITDRINQELYTHSYQYLINVASQEYAAVINREKLNYPVINIYFLENKGGNLKNIAINAKKARGIFVNFIITNKIVGIKQLKDFDIANYKYNSKLSDEGNYYFVRHF